MILILTYHQITFLEEASAEKPSDKDLKKTNEDTKAYYVIMERAGGLENPSGVQ